MRTLPRLTLEPLDVARDLGVLHTWVTHPRSAFWAMQDADVADVAAEYTRITEDPHHHAWLGRADAEPAFLAETYDPRLAGGSPVAGLPEVRAGDLGMHLLVAPPVRALHGFTRAVMATVLARCFADVSVRRVVVEPDVQHTAIAVLNAEAGFEVARVVRLPGKDAALSFCTRERWEAGR